jgi:hypothetical protein
MTVHDGVGGEVVHAREAHFLDAAQPVPHAAAGIGGVDAADDRDLFDDGQDFVLADLHGDGIGISIGHEAAGAAVAHHAEAAAVVDDDQIGTAFFDELGADARACTGGDDRLALGAGGFETVHDFLLRVGVSDSGPGIGHGLMWLTVVYDS